MKKYDISKEYGIYRMFRPPFGRMIFPVAAFACDLLMNFSKESSNLKVTCHKIETKDHNFISLYIYENGKKETDKVIFYIHGGGFVFKGYTSHFKNCERYVEEANCKVIYVDYRLAPKYPYPTPIDDCFCAYKWVLENAKQLGIDTHKLIVAGDSAGGSLAIELNFKIQEEHLLKPCYQMLIYPVVSPNMETSSMKKYIDTPMWNARLNKKAWKHYLQGKKYVSPFERSSLELSEMPLTYIETAEYDCLHDEGVEFAKLLEKVGVKVILNETKKTMHGFDIKACPTTEKVIQERIRFLNSI